MKSSIERRLKGKSAKQRATLKAQEIVKQPLVGTFTVDTIRIEIVAVEEIQRGVAVFARAWRKGKQLGFGKDGTVDIERFRIFNPPILVPDEAGEVERDVVDPESKEVIKQHFREDPAEAIRQVLQHTIAVVGKEKTRINKGKVGNTTSTFYPDAHAESTTVDGWIQSYVPSGDWQTAHDATDGTSADDSSTYFVVSSQDDGGESVVQRAAALFDTSPIGDTDTVSSATFSIYALFKNNSNSESFRLVSFAPASNTSLAVGDFDAFGTTGLASDKTIASVSTGAYNDVALTDLTAVSKTGITKLGLRIVGDITNTNPSGYNYVQASSADTSGTTQDPKLVVVHEAPAYEAEVTPVGLEISIPAVTATHTQIESASVASVGLEITLPAVTASFGATASVSPVLLEISIPEVTAEESGTASVSPVLLEISIPEIAPFFDASASVSPVLLEISIPTVTAGSVVSAVVAPVALTITVPAVAPSYELAPIPEPESAGGFAFALDLFDGSDVMDTLHSPIINVKGWSERINAPGKMVFLMNKHHPEATDDNLRAWRNIRLYRRKRDGTADMQAVWYGLILAKREMGEYMEVLCHGALRIFVKRETGANEAFTGQGSTEVFGLLTDANSTGTTGVTQGTGTVTTTLDLELDHVEMLRAFEEIHAATGGEFEVDELGALNSVPSLGSDKSEIIELIFRRDGQASNLISYEIAEDGEPMANRIIGTSTANGGMTSTYNHPTSTDDYPVLVERKAFNQAQDQNTLDALTEAYGLQRGLPIPDFRAVPATATKKFNPLTGQREITGLQYGDVEVGDLVLVTVITPNRNESVVKRIAELFVDVDENLNEIMRFTLTEAGVFVTERYLDDAELHDIKRRIAEIEMSL